jgi:drug/metabolite transporter (DMT)-like permease
VGRDEVHWSPARRSLQREDADRDAAHREVELERAAGVAHEVTVSARAWAIFAAVALLWGTPYLLIKVALDGGVPPAFLAWVRVVLGAAVLLAVAWRAGVLEGMRGRVRWLAAFTAAEVAVPFPLIAFGEQHVDSSLAAILIAAAPLFVALLALRFDATERAGGRRLAGMVIGLAGVGALVGVDVSGSATEMVGAGAVLIAAFCYAIGPMILKRHLSDIDPRASIGVSLVIGSVMLAPLAAADLPDAIPSQAAILALVALGLFCTALGMVLFGVLITEVGAGRALVVTYVCPLVAVGLGMALLAERPGPGAIVGLVLILVGSWFSTDGRLPRRVSALLGRLGLPRVGAS